MKTVRIAPTLELPLEFVTQACAILAKRRVGKSYTARRIVEQLVLAGQQVIIIDPKGDWWGVRSAADGKGPGLSSITILGGEHGDVPLSVDAGEAVARIAVEEQVSLLLDLSELRKHEVATFMVAFLETLYRLKAREAYRTPVMVVVDEGDAIAPQKPQPNEARMLGAAEDLVRRGGQRGIGTMFITQRSAVLNKNVLTQVQVLIALRTIAPQDLAAMDEWINVHGEPGQRKTLMTSLPSLPVGDAWVWSPGWPDGDGIFERVHVDPIETFDSGATPKPGEKRVEPRLITPVDLDRIRGLMAGAGATTESDEPKVLRARIAELERQLVEESEPQVREVPVPIPVDWPALGREIEADMAFAFGVFEERLRETLDRARSKASTAELPGLPPAPRPMPERPGVPPAPRPGPPLPRRVHLDLTHRDTKPGKSSKLGAGERTILTAITQHPDGVTREQLTVLTGYKRSSRDTFLQRLHAAGLVERQDDGRIAATRAGVKELGPGFRPLPTGRALLEHWLERLPEGERRVLDVVAKAHPRAVERAAIDERTGYKRSSRDTFLQRLGARRLVVSEGRGAVRMSPELS